ncbi:23062_t:CDS:2 [Rhizophagus irregularis]|nr:23062_t:CDS:2 [Rhizophagus irregularis]
MLKNSLANFTLLWMLLQVLVEVNCQMTPFKPSALNCHTATFIDNKLYILSGLSTISYKSVKEFFYLDVSVPFNTRELSWQDLSNINMVPPHGLATSAKGGVNNDTLFLYGGNNQTMESVYTFDPHHMIWNPPKITGISTIRKSSLTGVMGYNGKFYLWSGRTPIISNDMLILDTISLNWEKGSLVNAPTPRIFYGATLLPNDKIIYIGGLNDVTTEFDDDTLNIDKGIALSLSEVYLYDMINDNWDVKITTGKIPSNRCGFSSVLGLDGQRVIIYGGAFNNPGYLDTTLYVLDLTNYNWYIPKISGIIPKPRVFHQANVVEKYMVISFGIGYDRTVESDILLLDISNNEEYVWTTSFVPSPSSTSDPLPTSSNNSSDNSKMVGAIVGSLLSGIFLLVGEKAIPTEGSKNENMTNHEVVSAIVNNDNYYGQEVVTTPTNNDGFKFFKLLNKK